MSRLLCDQMALSCVTFGRLRSTGSPNEAEGNQMPRWAADLRITSLSDGALVQWDKQHFFSLACMPGFWSLCRNMSKCWLMFDVLEWVYLNFCTFLSFFSQKFMLYKCAYLYKFILKGSFSFVLHMSISNLDRGTFKATGWFANFVVFLRVSLIPLWQSHSPRRVIHQVIYFQRMA